MMQNNPAILLPNLTNKRTIDRTVDKKVEEIDLLSSFKIVYTRKVERAMQNSFFRKRFQSALI